MADNVTTLALLALEQKLRGDIVKQVNRRSALLRVLPILPGEGKNCSWAVEGDGALGENYAEGADATNFGGDAQKSAKLDWGHYRSNFHVTGTARRAARRSSTPGGVQNLVGRHMKSSIAKVASIVNTALFTGPGTGTTIGGLNVAIGDDTNTYASIDRSDSNNAFFRPTVVDPGQAEEITLGLIREDQGKISDLCGEQPDIAVCSTSVFNAIGGLFDESRRYVYDITTSRGQIKLDASIGAIEIDGTYFMKDKDAPAGRIYYLNSHYVHLEYLPPDQEFMDELEMEMYADDGYGATPLGVICHKLAKNGDSDRYECLTNVQLVVERPNACGVRKNIATS